MPEYHAVVLTHSTEGVPTPKVVGVATFGPAHAMLRHMQEGHPSATYELVDADLTFTLETQVSTVRAI